MTTCGWDPDDACGLMRQRRGRVDFSVIRESSMNSGSNLRVLIVGVALAVITSGARAQAQEPSEKTDRPTIRVMAESTIQAKPDQAELSLGVVTQATTGQAAAMENAKKQDAVLEQLRKLLGSGA